MKLTWDDTGSRLIETGVSKAVLYPVDSSGNYAEGVAWSGLISVTVSPDVSDSTPIYANSVKIAESNSTIEFNGSIEAFTYPDEFDDCVDYNDIPGMRFGFQACKRFGLVWKSKLNSDIENQNHGYKLHILYGCTAQPSEISCSTINNDIELANFLWSFSTLQSFNRGYSESQYIELDSSKTNAISLSMLEQILYGTDSSIPRLPKTDEIITIMQGHDDDWVKGVFPYFDNISYPYYGTYKETMSGFYLKHDERRF